MFRAVAIRAAAFSATAKTQKNIRLPSHGAVFNYFLITPARLSALFVQIFDALAACFGFVIIISQRLKCITSVRAGITLCLRVLIY